VTAVIVRHRHVRAMGYCNAGARDFCRRHGFDWPDFLARGVPAERLAAIDDDMVRALIECARKDQHGQQQ